ncbi:MAG TPA: N-formylglutamate amidohydrolase [Methyloceanibacter sp.]|nr:N-formylglutamate amidohydrolase [Methyloceanibacter sp.]
MGVGDLSPVVEENPDGSGPFVILCDHASNRIPQDYEPFGLSEEALKSHIAWDPGALPVARLLSEALHAPLLWPDVSRLIIDCNRAPEAKSLIVAESEGRPIPANRNVSEADRARRLDRFHRPYHAAVDACLTRRRNIGLPTALVAIHSYTPVYFGRSRPWQIGILFDADRRLADPLIAGLQADPALTVGINEPYSPADQVYYTLERHAARDRLPAAMIEIRNDEIEDASGQRRWANRLKGLLFAAHTALLENGKAVV